MTSKADDVHATGSRSGLVSMDMEDMAVCALDTAGRVIGWNRGAARLFGFGSAEILGQSYQVFFTTDAATCARLDAWFTGHDRTDELHTECGLVRRDGDLFSARVFVSVVNDGSGSLSGFMMLIHDLTRLKVVQDILRSQGERLKANSRRLVELQEAERQHLARELHDLVGPKLTALGINLQLINGMLGNHGKPGLTDVLRDSVEHVHTTADILRYIIGELRPHALDDFGLRAALQSHVERFVRVTGIQVDVHEPAAGGYIPDLIQMSLFRIAQEALNNIARHSQARKVDITLMHTRTSISLTIQDDGIGFDSDGAGNESLPRGYGLSIMRERAEAIGANMQFESAPGRGVRLTLYCHY